MALLAEAFALAAPPVLPATRLASKPGRPRREVCERGVPSALAAATVLVTGVVAKRQTAETRVTAVARRVGPRRNSRLTAQTACRAEPRDSSKSSQAPKSPYEEQDPMELMKQLFGGDFSTPPGGAGQAGMENPLAALMGAGAGQPKKKVSDSFFTEKFPILQKMKRPLLVAFFLYCFHRGWVGRWGLVSGMMAGSYFDMLAVPLRVLEKSPFRGRAYIVTQIYVDYLFKLIGYLINLAKGKAKFPPDFSSMFTPPGAGAGGANPFGAPGANPFGAPGANPFADLGGSNPFDIGNMPDVDVPPPGGPYQAPPVQPTDMPTAPTVRPATPAPSPASMPRPAMHVAAEQPASPPKPPPSRNPPPVIDADVVFLD